MSRASTQAPVDLDAFEGATPGPWWRASQNHDREAFDVGEGDTIIATVRASVAGGFKISRYQPEHGEANARLIAAAPQLAAEVRELRADRDALAAALRAITDHCGMLYEGTDAPMRDLLRNGRAALARVVQP